MLCVFHVNTTILMGDLLSRLHFAFETDEASSVEEFARRIAEYGYIYGHRLHLRRTDEPDVQVIVGRTATMIMPGGLALVTDWSKGRIVEEEIVRG